MVPGIGVECVCLSGAMLAKAGTVLDVCLAAVWLGGIDFLRCVLGGCCVLSNRAAIQSPGELPTQGVGLHRAQDQCRRCKEMES